MKPLIDQVLIVPQKEDNKTSTGILLIEGKDKPAIGKVLAKGIKANKEIKKGNIVAYKKYVGTEIKFGGMDCILVSSENVLAIL